MADKTTPVVPEDPQSPPRLPLDPETFNVKVLRAITYDQLFMGSLLVEMRLLNAQMAELIEATKTKE